MSKYDRHIRELCRKHGIRIIYVQRDYSCNIYNKKVWIKRDIRSIKTYIAALHEIGHILNEHRFGLKNLFRDNWDMARNRKITFTSRYILKKEVQAWMKAFKLAKWLKKSAYDWAAYGLSTYMESYNESHKKRITIDKLLAMRGL